VKQNLTILSILIVILSLCLLFLLDEDESDRYGAVELEVFCAAGLRKPVQAVALQYEAEYGVKVHLNYGGSGQLYGSIKLRGGDLYIPADWSYIDSGVSEGVIAESVPLSYLTAGMVVQQGNPRGVRDLQDLKRSDVKVAIAVQSAAVGRFTHEVLADVRVLKRIESNRLSKFPTVNEVAAQVKLGAVDVGIIWNGLMSQYDELEFIRVPEFDAQPKLAAVGVISSGEQRARSLHFAHYLAARDKGGMIFQMYGYEMKEGFYWKEMNYQH